MSAIKNLYQLSRDFKQNWLSYLLVFLSLDLLIQVIIIPFFRYLTTFVLQAGAIPFVSYQNLVTIITTHTLIFIILLIELLALVCVIYTLFSFLLISVQAINNGQFSINTSLKQTWKAVKKIRLGSLVLLLLYFILIVPFTNLVFRTSLLAKVQIPEFIMDYMTRSPLLITILIVAYLIFSILGLRLIYTLPIMILKGQKTWIAMKSSWQKTKRGAWLKLLWELGLLFILTMLILFAFYSSLYFMQLIWDLFPGKYPYYLAIVNMTLIQLLSQLILVWSYVVAFLLLFKKLSFLKKLEKGQPKNKSLLVAVLLVLLLGAVAIPANSAYLKNERQRPIIISHRGVSDKNGVQNTLPALKKTTKLKPDYVEIDLHESKDKQFVVMHDETLKKLTGKNKTPKDLTLKQLTKLTAKEDGHRVKIASFDQYLKLAKKLRQKLLIEIKTTPLDSKKMLQRFNQQYGQTIIKDHDIVQSLDYRVVEGLKEINPKLKVMYIQPYNFTYPKSKADGYSMEYSTLNSDFIHQAHVDHHPVYAWTVNESSLMKKLMYEHVDGIITDKIPEVKEAIKDYRDHSSYAKRLLNYIIVFPSSSLL